MEFDVPIMNEGVGGGTSNNVGNIRTVIPDAYELSLTVTGLNEETRNFIYASVKKDKLTVNKPVEG
jgi:metal-dependent amidase/aminoacylase/carboxypeptidase family protein